MFKMRLPILDTDELLSGMTKVLTGKIFIDLNGCMTHNEIQSPCHQCKNARSIPGDCHIACANPPKVIEANEHGMKNGWFAFPLNFDPVWRTGECGNFDKKIEKET
jgi:hypothetical protein